MTGTIIPTSILANTGAGHPMLINPTSTSPNRITETHTFNSIGISREWQRETDAMVNPKVGSECRKERPHLSCKSSDQFACIRKKQRKYPKVKLTTDQKRRYKLARRRLYNQEKASRSNKGCSHRNLREERAQAQKQATIIYSKPLGNAGCDEVLDPTKMLQRERDEALRYNVYFGDARAIGPGHLPGRTSVKIKNITRNCSWGCNSGSSHTSDSLNFLLTSHAIFAMDR